MAHLEEPQFRLAGAADAEAVANLHADSWRRHYRRLFQALVPEQGTTAVGRGPGANVRNRDREAHRGLYPSVRSSKARSSRKWRSRAASS